MVKKQEVTETILNTPVVQEVICEKELVWINPKREPFEEASKGQELTLSDIDDAEERLKRFAPLIKKCFPETIASGGIIESELVSIDGMQKKINKKYSAALKGKLFLKKDSHLAIAGSVKARGGIYEVLKYTESLALQNNLITIEEPYDRLASAANKRFLSNYTIQVGSTGNLGMSIGIMSAAIGYRVIVHMSSDAKQWKKDLLRKHGVLVKEYETDYSEAVLNGRKQSDSDPNSYFVDDENSRNLFLGYAVAAKRLIKQLEDLDVAVDAEHPLFVFIPCGVGGAPGGVTFGLKQLFKDTVHCFFIEPTKAPCMLLGMSTNLHNNISVKDVGLSGLTHADGLAVGCASGFVGKVMEPLLSGVFTINDKNLYEYMRDLLESEDIFIEPSACAAFAAPIHLNDYEEAKQYLVDNGLTDKMERATHIAWATGGSLVPRTIRDEYRNTYLY